MTTACYAAVLAAAPPAPAAELGGGDELTRVEVHGFVSQGYFLTMGNAFISPSSKSGSLEFSEVGINFTKNLTDSLQLGVQLFAQDRGLVGNYVPRFDWYHLDYLWRDWLGLRFGRLKIPYGLYNEVFDIDAARVPVLLPGSVYPLQAREILFSHTGAELYGFVRTESLGAFEYRLFAGTIFWDASTIVPPNAGLTLTFDFKYLVGGRLLWETPLEGLRVGGSVQALRFESTAFVPMLTIGIENDSQLWVASAEYAPGDLALTFEYSRWHTEQITEPQVQPDVDEESERAYLMASYRVTPWLQPAAYYSLLYPNRALRSGRANQQHDVALTLRFDINPHWIVKAEGHYMSGTASLRDPLQVDVPGGIAQTNANWAAYFLKATAHF